MDYLINNKANTKLVSGYGETIEIGTDIFELALLDVHKIIEKITKDIPVDIFSILGMRNLSAFIGELFALSLIKESNDIFVGNPHQDGYPDLLLMDKQGKKIWYELLKKGQLRDKHPFSPFKNGGIEVKATCGSVPTPKVSARRGNTKPGMGDTRIEVMMGYDWKAHHRETNNLVGILWDFYEGIPQIVAIFYGNNLDENDWGVIIQPRSGGGRTTSVSIMPRSGVKKMYNNWIAVKNDHKYINFINNYNSDSIIKILTTG